jgi:hypothetical protein
VGVKSLKKEKKSKKKNIFSKEKSKKIKKKTQENKDFFSDFKALKIQVFDFVVFIKGLYFKKFQSENLESKISQAFGLNSQRNFFTKKINQRKKAAKFLIL